MIHPAPNSNRSRDIYNNIAFPMTRIILLLLVVIARQLIKANALKEHELTKEERDAERYRDTVERHMKERDEELGRKYWNKK